MTSQVNVFSQLGTFDIIRNILLTSPVLNEKFTSNDYYQFEPKVKATDFNGYPYIIIKVPETDNAMDYLGDLTDEKEFTVNISMVNEYHARSNIPRYAAALLGTIGGTASTFTNHGYEFKSINVTGSPEPTTMHDKDIVITEFELLLNGEMLR